MLNLRKQEPPRPSDSPAPVPAQKSVYERFPSPKPEAAPAMNATTTQPAAATTDDGPTDFVIGRGTRLKGEIEAAGDVIVEGTVEAVRWGAALDPCCVEGAVGWVATDCGAEPGAHVHRGQAKPGTKLISRDVAAPAHGQVTSVTEAARVVTK